MRDATAWDGDGVEKPLAELRSVLIPGETLEAWAIQRRIFALSHRRVLIAATSGRRERCGPATAGSQAAARREAHHRCGVRGHQGEDRVVVRRIETHPLKAAAAEACDIQRVCTRNPQTIHRAGALAL